MGGRGAGSGMKSFPKIPYSVAAYGGKYSTKEERASVRKSVKEFISKAKEGQRYRIGADMAGSGGVVEIVHHRGGLGLKYVGSSTQPIKLNPSNVKKVFVNGATYIGKAKRMKSVSLFE